MSGKGAPLIQTAGHGIKVAVIAGSWHEEVMKGLIAGANKTLAEAKANYSPETDLFRVAGAFELPVAARAALKSGYDTVVCLGVIVRGGTPHFEYVCNAVTDGLTRVALDCDSAVGFGVLTVDTDEQALDRAGLPDSKESKGQEAAEAALSTAHLLKRFYT